MFVKFVFEVEYEEWWDDDNKKWMPSSWQCVVDDFKATLGNLGDVTLKVTANDVVLYDASQMV